MLNPEKPWRQNIIVFYILTSIAIGSILIAINGIMTLGSIKDPPNLSALILEIGIGVIITVTVFAYSKRQHEENKIQQKSIENLLTSIKEIEERQQKLIEEAETFRKRKHDYVIHTIRSSFTLFLSLLQQNIESLDQIKNDDSVDDGILINNLFDNKYFLLDELRNLEQILDSQAGAIDPSFEKNTKDICDELKQWQRNRDPYEYPDSSRTKTARMTTLMKETLEKLPNPPV